MELFSIFNIPSHDRILISIKLINCTLNNFYNTNKGLLSDNIGKNNAFQWPLSYVIFLIVTNPFWLTAFQASYLHKKTQNGNRYQKTLSFFRVLVYNSIVGCFTIPTYSNSQII